VPHVRVSNAIRIASGDLAAFVDQQRGADEQASELLLNR